MVQLDEEEVIRGVLTGGELNQARVFGGKSGDYDLIFTDSKIVFAMVANTKKAGMMGGALGMALAKNSSANKRDQYQQMSISQIIEHDAHNFAIPYSEVEWVNIREVKKVFNIFGFNFKWKEEQYSCTFPGSQADVAKQMVSQFLKSKIRDA